MRDRHWIALAAFVALGAALRFATLGVQSYWYDEAVTVGLLEMDLGGMLREIPNSESTPPLYYLLAWLWSKLFGTGEAGLRSLSALFGTAAIPAAYAAARELLDRRVGLAVAGLAAVNPLLVWYSQEARTYALLMLLGTLSVLFFARVLRRAARRDLILWALFSALALASHYFAAFLLVPEAVWLAVAARDRRPVLLAIAVVGAVALALAPLALHQRSLDLASFIRSIPLPFRIARTPKQYLVGFESPLEIATSVLAAAIATWGIARAWLRLRGQRGIRIAALLGVATVAMPLVLALVGADYFDTRNAILTWLPLATVVAAGLLVADGRAGLAATAVLGFLGVASVVGVALEPTWQRDDWEGAARSLGPASTGRAVVITPTSGAIPFKLYRPDARVMPKAGVRLRELALISRPRRTRRDTHPPPPPRPARPLVPTGFVEVRREYADTYSLIVLRAPTALGLRPEALKHYRLLRKTDASVFVQDPSSPAGGN
jgi:mannosyltransferase